MSLFDRIAEMNNEKSATFSYTPPNPSVWRLSIDAPQKDSMLAANTPEPVHQYSWTWPHASLVITAPDRAGRATNGNIVLFVNRSQITAYFNGEVVMTPLFGGVQQLEYDPAQPSELIGLHRLQAVGVR